MGEALLGSEMTSDQIVQLGLSTAFPNMRDIDEKLVTLPAGVKRRVADLVAQGLGNQDGVPTHAIREIYTEYLRNPH